MYIQGVEENHLLYIDDSPKYEVLLQCKGYKKYHSVPTAELLYVPIHVGAYRSKSGRGVYYLSRRHQKSYKIGLSEETFNIQCLTPNKVFFDRAKSDIDLSSPVYFTEEVKTYQVFSHRLVRVGTNLVADGETIGFMEGERCILRHKLFENFVRPFLGDKWQIES